MAGKGQQTVPNSSFSLAGRCLVFSLLRSEQKVSVQLPGGVYALILCIFTRPLNIFLSSQTVHPACQ